MSQNTLKRYIIDLKIWELAFLVNLNLKLSLPRDIYTPVLHSVENKIATRVKISAQSPKNNEYSVCVCGGGVSFAMCTLNF